MKKNVFMWCCTLMLIFSIVCFSNGNIPTGIVFLVLCFSFSWLVYFEMQKSEQKSELMINSLPDFTISKQQMAGNYKFLIDAVHKKFAIIKGASLKVYKFSDLLDFELNEDGNSIARGKGGSVLVGAAVLGPLGAVMGAVGKRKHESTCSSMIVRVILNDLQEPQIVISFIKGIDVKKSSNAYRVNLEQAKALTATLTYIQSQTN